jgi:hypothetical protein
MWHPPSDASRSDPHSTTAALSSLQLPTDGEPFDPPLCTTREDLGGGGRQSGDSAHFLCHHSPLQRPPSSVLWGHHNHLLGNMQLVSDDMTLRGGALSPARPCQCFPESSPKNTSSVRHSDTPEVKWTKGFGEKNLRTPLKVLTSPAVKKILFFQQ